MQGYEGWRNSGFGASKNPSPGKGRIISKKVSSIWGKKAKGQSGALVSQKPGEKILGSQWSHVACCQRSSEMRRASCLHQLYKHN